ncbi:LADA_0C01662g1_1 [Lachancea dasiensis]|uniref:Nuclear pore complex protein n=1 Tax=Lachancea dasiensis TaxID=1072105 RepID=A0A1G4IY77_9SACH|nr:LADA_0C01662g1_1 [Lachancea dasiensis]
MEIDSPQSFAHLVKYANLLKDFKISELSEPQSRDVFDIVKDFRAITGEAALELINMDESSDIETAFENWDLEAKLWHLIELLINFRTADISFDQNDIGLQGPLGLELIYRKTLLESDKSLYELWLIMVWIQSNVKAPERPANIGTSKWPNSFLSGDLRSSDLDFPLRDSGCKIDAKDLESDQAFYKYAYELILAGQLDDVRRECEYSDNLTLALILCGIDDQTASDSETPDSGNPKTKEAVYKRALWRRAVHALSLSEDLGHYERAIYSYLAGDVVYAADTITLNWDTELLLYLNQSWQTTFEKHVLSEHAMDTKDILAPIEATPLSLQNILDLVSSKHASESEHPLRVLMGAVILDKIPEIVNSSVQMLVNAIKGIEPGNDMVEEPYLLRVVTHVVIVMDMIYPGSIQEHDKSSLITAYVTILSLYELYDIIPIYISFLGEEETLEAYSFFLSNLIDAGVRRKQLELCRTLEMPTTNILKKTAQRIFEETSSSYVPITGVNVHAEIEETDKRLVAGAEWLLEGRLHVDALEAYVVISRRFLITGRIGSLRYLYEKQDLSNLIKNYELDTLHNSDGRTTAVQEIHQYQALLDMFQNFEHWQQLSANSEDNASLPHSLDSLKTISGAVYKFVKTFLVELSEVMNSEDQDVIHEIRALYTPYMVFELHQALVAASEDLKVASFVTEALSLATLVANETDQIYLLFQSSGRLEEYLQLIAKTATLV